MLSLIAAEPPCRSPILLPRITIIGSKTGVLAAPAFGCLTSAPVRSGSSVSGENVREGPTADLRAAKKLRSWLSVSQTRTDVATGGEASWCRMSTSSAFAGVPRSLKASIGLVSVKRLSRVSRRMR